MGADEEEKFPFSWGLQPATVWPRVPPVHSGRPHPHVTGSSEGQLPLWYRVFGLSLGSSLIGGVGLEYRGWHSASVRGLSQASLSNVKAIKATSSVRSGRASGSGGAATTHLTSTPKDARPDPGAVRAADPLPWGGAGPRRPSSPRKAGSVAPAAVRQPGPVPTAWRPAVSARQRSARRVMGLHADPLGQPGDPAPPSQHPPLGPQPAREEDPTGRK